jgi:hypothetical protein
MWVIAIGFLGEEKPRGKGGSAAEEGNAQGLSDGEKERKPLGVFYLPIEKGVNAGDSLRES